MSRAEFLKATGAAVAAIGTTDFPAALAQLLRTVAPYSYLVVFGYRGMGQPLDLYNDFPEDKHRVFVTEYQEGPYLLDPFYLAANRPVAAGLYRMRDLAPDRFYQGEYFRSYYSRTGLAEEIGFFIKTGDDSMVVVSLMRAERPFSARDLRDLQEICPVVDAVGRRHWGGHSLQSASPANPRGQEQTDRIEKSFHSFGQGVLTQRERQIVEYTLKGHSAEALGEILGIAPGTVRIHRRNIYAKLRITSQGELFSKFIQTLGQV